MQVISSSELICYLSTITSHQLIIATPTSFHGAFLSHQIPMNQDNDNIRRNCQTRNRTKDSKRHPRIKATWICNILNLHILQLSFLTSTYKHLNPQEINQRKLLIIQQHYLNKIK